MKRNYFLYLLIIASAVLTRILPHAWNFAPVSAIAIVAAVYLPKKQAFALPLAIRLVSDAIIGFFAWPQMLAVYLSHMVGVALGLWIKQNKTFTRVVAAPIISALVFYLITNFAFLYPASAYSHNWAGILLAYTNGLPFLRGTLIGDTAYTWLLVGVFEAVMVYQSKSREQKFILAK